MYVRTFSLVAMEVDEPARGATFTKVPWDIHRPDALLQELYSGDYKLDKTDDSYIEHYKVNDKRAKGVSCFVPLESPHNLPNEKLSKEQYSCYFLPKGTSLSEGLALIYTHKMKLRFPSGVQTGLHFVIAPMMHMKKEIYEQATKDLGWQLCTIKASAEAIELISLDDDLDNVEDFRMNELYWLMEIWHKQTTYAMDRLHANDIHTWIALDKPSFQDLIQDESRAYIVFSALARMNARTPASHVTELTYLGDILGELEDAFGWESSELCAQVGEVDVEDKFEKDIKKWNKQQVAKFLKSSLNLDEKYIRKIQEQEINGSTFLLLKEETLIRRPGPFEFPFGIAIAISELVNTFRAREKKIRGITIHLTNNGKGMTEDIISQTIEHVRQIESSLKILLGDRFSDKSNSKWTIEEKLVLLDAVHEYLPSSLPWTEIAEKFEERFPRRSISGCRNQWLRRKEKGLIYWLMQSKD